VKRYTQLSREIDALEAEIAREQDKRDRLVAELRKLEREFIETAMVVDGLVIDVSEGEP